MLLCAGKPSKAESLFKNKNIVIFDRVPLKICSVALGAARESFFIVLYFLFYCLNFRQLY